MLILCRLNNRFMSIIVISYDIIFRLAQLCLIPRSSYGWYDLWPSDSSHHNQENLEFLDLRNIIIG